MQCVLLCSIKLGFFLIVGTMNQFLKFRRLGIDLKSINQKQIQPSYPANLSRTMKNPSFLHNKKKKSSQRTVKIALPKIMS